MEDEIFFNQSKYIKEMLKNFGLKDFKPTKTPMSTEIKLTKDDKADSVDSSKYRENPKTTHLEAVKRIFRYIRGTSHLGLWYPKGTRIETIVYADSDHAGDYVDRKSTSDVHGMLFNILVLIMLGMMKSDYKRTKAYIPKIHHQRSTPNNAKNSFKNLRNRFIHEGRHIESSFTFGNDIVDQFKPIQFDCLLTLNGHICPRFIIEFYHKFQLIRNVHDMSLSIGFTIRDKEFIMSLEKFGQVLQIPYKGTCIFSKECSLELLNTTREKHVSYQTILPNIGDVVQNICLPSCHQNCSNPTIILRDNLPPNIKDWELIIRENVICVDTHKSSIDACSAIILYHLKNSQNFNLAYFIAHKIESVKDRVDCPLPYGLLITRLYRFILTKHPKIFCPHHSLQFVLHYRMMSSINRKNARKRSKHKEVKIDMPYSPLSVESSNQTSPLLGYWSSMDQF
ncbi:hypothetical protein Tco_0591106 [Tanacetum coccineum]